MPEGTMPPVHDLPELPTPADMERTVRDLIEAARAQGCEINPAEDMNAGGGPVELPRG